MNAAIERRDVVIAGAGLVGLSLAAALARAGMTVALLDRLPPPASADPDTWDARVYAISPGSASFLQRVGAWQALSAVGIVTSRIRPRLTPIRRLESRCIVSSLLIVCAVRRMPYARLVV